MEKTGLTCPVCGKYEFEDFDGLDRCPTCNWVNNIRQYDNHDFSEGPNHLSVNENKIEYALMSSDNTREAAEKLKAEFLGGCNRLYEEFRKNNSGKDLQSCADMNKDKVTHRLAYVEKLNQLRRS